MSSSKNISDDPSKLKEENEAKLDDNKIDELRVSATASPDEYPLLVTMLSGEKIRICCKPTDTILDIKKVLWAVENVKEDMSSYILRLKNAETFYQDKQLFRDFLTHFLLFREENFQDTLEAVVIDKKDIGDHEKRKTKIPAVNGLNRAQGSLKKKGSGATHKWQERYFVLQDNTLFYFGSWEDYDRKSPASEVIPMGSCIAEIIAQGRPKSGFHHVRNFSAINTQRPDIFPTPPVTPSLTSPPTPSSLRDASDNSNSNRGNRDFSRKGVNLGKLPNPPLSSSSPTGPPTPSYAGSSVFQFEAKGPNPAPVRYIFRLAADAVGKREFLLRTKQSETLRLFVHAIQSLNLQRIKLIVLDMTKELLDRASRDLLVAGQIGESKEAQTIMRAYAYAQYPKLKNVEDLVLSEVLTSALSSLENTILPDAFAQGFLKIGPEKISPWQIKTLLVQHVVPAYRTLLEYLVSFFYTLTLHPETTGLSTMYIATTMENTIFGAPDPFSGSLDRVLVLKTLIQRRPDLWPMTTEAYMHDLRSTIYAATPVPNRIRRPPALELSSLSMTPRAAMRRSSRTQLGTTALIPKPKDKTEQNSFSGSGSGSSSAHTENKTIASLPTSRVRFPLTFHFPPIAGNTVQSVEIRTVEELTQVENIPFSPGRYYLYEDILHPKLGNQPGAAPDATLGSGSAHHLVSFEYANKQHMFVPEVIALGYFVQRGNFGVVTQITNYLCSRPPLPRKPSSAIGAVSASEPSFLDRMRRQTLADHEEKLNGLKTTTGTEKKSSDFERQWARSPFSYFSSPSSRFVQDDDDDFVDIDTSAPPLFPPETPRYGYPTPSPRVKQSSELQELLMKNRQQNLNRRNHSPAPLPALSPASSTPAASPASSPSSNSSSSAPSTPSGSLAMLIPTTTTTTTTTTSTTANDDAIPPPPDDGEVPPPSMGSVCTHDEAHVYCPECKEALCRACDEAIHTEAKVGHVRGAFKSLSISITVPPIPEEEELPPPPPDVFPIRRSISDTSERDRRESASISSTSGGRESTSLGSSRRESNSTNASDISTSRRHHRTSSTEQSNSHSSISSISNNNSISGSLVSHHARTDSNIRKSSGHHTNVSWSDASHLKLLEKDAPEKVLKPLAFSVDSTFESVMRYAEARNCFLKFLATEFSDENMLFWDEVNKFCEADVRTQYRLAQHIFTTYFGPQATKQVNVRGMYAQLKDALTIEDEAEAVAQCTFLFLEAQTAVVQLLKYDSYSRFKASPQWQTFIDNFKQREWIRFKVVKMKKMHKNVVRVIQFDSNSMALTFFKPDNEGEFTQEDLRVPAGSLVNVQLSVTNNKKLKLTFFKTDQRLLRNQKEWRLIFRTSAERERLARVITSNLLLKQSSVTERSSYQPQPLMMEKKTIQAMKLLPVEEVAGELHEYYVAGKKSEGWVYGEVYNEDEKVDPALMPWHHMNDKERGYEMDVASLTIGSILELGYSITPQSFDDTTTMDLEEDSRLLLLVEFLSENAHDCWAAKKFKQGWVYGETRSEHDKTHPNLIPYIDLDEADMDWNRQAAIGVLRALLERGFKIEPLD